VYREQGEIRLSIKDFETFYRMASGTEAKDANNGLNELVPPGFENLAQERSAFQEGGLEAYWHKRLDNQMKRIPVDPHEVAVCLKHLGKLQEAYDCLNGIKDPGRLRERLWHDISFDRGDRRFKALVTKCGSAVIPAAELSNHR
jgi:hypothetical protein